MKHLSRLQKVILSLASEKDIVSPADVKAAYYGFPLRRKGRFSFCVVEIGFNRYRAAAVCISRAFVTLARKGLVKRLYEGVSLTDKVRVWVLCTTH